ncbi:MAG TPA: fused MFS/spermidine synthase [Thermoanaerobaculia bacterium]|nr:fused MFS/spermidine synthase [Thermoanaerobaculia bacterium]
MARVALLLLGSGFCALAYQTAWLRMLRLVFGASTASSAAVLAIFMGGLGFGGLLLGRIADRRRSPLAFYAGLEAGIALAAGLSPWLVVLIQKIYIALGGSGSLGMAGGTVVRLVLSALVLGIPTFLMGGTLPALARAVEQASDSGRRRTGLLYALNTLGAVAGALVTTFWSLEHLGIRLTIWVAALLNLAIAGVAWGLSRRMKMGEPEAAEESVEPKGTAFVPWAAGVVGFAFLLMELVWYRMLAPLLGGSSYTFGLILAVALLGIGLGGLLYGGGPRQIRPTLAGFALTCSLEALALATPFALGDRLAVLAVILQPLSGAGFFPLVLGWTLVTAIVVLPAAIVAGYQFPLLIALLGSGNRRVGREVGVTYAANTVGSIAGSITGGFGLLPLLSAPGVWRLVAVLLLALALAAVLLHVWRERDWRSAAVPIALALAGALLISAPGPSAFWRHSPIGAGRVSGGWDDPNELRDAIQSQRRGIVWERDGVESSVAVDVTRETAFLVNGKADGSARGDAPTQIMSGLVGSMLHPNPRRALVIGLGTGSTAGWLAAVPTMERVDVVELEPAMVEVAGRFAPVNHGALSSPKVRLVIGDGRELLLTTRERYDVLFSEPSNPYRAGIASLFTRDFYEAVRDRLNPDGIFLQWLQGYEVDAEVVATVYAALGAVFPAVETWEINSGDLLLVATREPLAHDFDRVRLRAGQPPYAEALLRTWGVEGAEGFYTGYIASPDFGRALARRRGSRPDTDDRPVLEFGFARNLGRSGLFRVPDLVSLVRSRGENRPEAGGTPLDWDLVEEMRQARSLVWRDPVRGKGRNPEAELRRLARDSYSDLDLKSTCKHWFSQPAPPSNYADLLLTSECLAATGDPRAPEYAAQLRRKHTVDADLVLAIWHDEGGRTPEAVRHLVAAFEGARRDPWPSIPLLDRVLQHASDIASRDPKAARAIDRALSERFAVGMVDQDRLRLRLELTWLLREGCVEALAPFEPHPPWEDLFLAQRARCYREAGHPLADPALADRARAELVEYMENVPPRLEMGLPPQAP